MKRERKGSRIVLLKPDLTFLMLHFAYARGPLAGTDYWGLPGGGHEAGETPAEAAVRELFEETGLRVGGVGELFAESSYDFRLASGEDVIQHDYYYVVRIGSGVTLSRDALTPEETSTLVGEHWWRLDELSGTTQRIQPDDLFRVLEASGVFEKP